MISVGVGPVCLFLLTRLHNGSSQADGNDMSGTAVRSPRVGDLSVLKVHVVRTIKHQISNISCKYSE